VLFYSRSIDHGDYLVPFLLLHISARLGLMTPPPVRSIASRTAWREGTWRIALQRARDRFAQSGTLISGGT
jgi:hypothetical protein